MDHVKSLVIFGVILTEMLHQTYPFWGVRAHRFDNFQLDKL